MKKKVQFDNYSFGGPAKKRVAEYTALENTIKREADKTPFENPAKKRVADKTALENPAKKRVADNTVLEKPTKKRVEENTALESPTENRTSNTFEQSPKNPSSSKSTLISDEIQKAISLHSDGVNGNKSAVQKAFDMFKSLYEKEPNNTEIAAYYGSATALMGRDEANLTKRMKYALSGLKLLDSVVEKSPELPLARFLRGNVCYRLPEMYFHRTDTAIEDFKYLINFYEQDNRILTKSEYETVLKNLIKACETLNRAEEAKKYREKFKALSQIINESQESKDSQDNTESKEGQIHNEVSKQSGEALTELDEESFQIYQKALRGGITDVNKAIEYFSNLEADHPNDPLIRAYTIDCSSLLGRDANNTFEMFASGIKAMKALDVLVNEHPNHINIKKIRAFQSFRLPETFFRKTASAIKDFEELIRQYEQDQSIFSTEEYLELLFHLGEGYARLGMNDEANSVWNKLLQLNPSAGMKEKLRERQDILAFRPIDLSRISVSQSEKLFKVGKELHEVGVAGSKQAAQQALDLWEKAVEAFPEDSTAKTYHAASVALMGKFADEAQGMFGETIRGLKLLKSAFNSTNQTAELLLLRGYIYYALPEAFFHKTDSAIKDFKTASSLYKQGDRTITREKYLKLLVDLGIAYERSHFQDKAQKTWSLLAKEDTEGQYIEFRISKGVENQ